MRRSDKINKTWVVVDGYSSGKYFAQLLKDRGISCVHIQSTASISDYFGKSFQAQSYIQCLEYSAAEYSSLLNKLKKFNVRFVVPGSETGVELAERIASDLSLPKNSSGLKSARTNKYEMVRALGDANLRLPKTILIASLDEVDRAIQEIGLPIVVKPNSSAGSDAVEICDDVECVFKSVSAIIGRRNLLGRLNQSAVCQEVLDGQQYVVNTISVNGRHEAVEVWKDYRVDGKPYLYDREELIVDYGDLEHGLINYSCAVLDAVGVGNGACHVELMVRDRVPTLIEVGARPAGGIDHEVMVDAQGYSQISAFIARCEDGDYEHKGKVKAKKTVLAVALRSTSEGKLRSIKNLDKPKSLPSFKSIKGLPSIGDYVDVTRDMKTQPGLLMLSHQDRDAANRDLEAFRRIEQYLLDIGSLR